LGGTSGTIAFFEFVENFKNVELQSFYGDLVSYQPK